MKTKDRFPLFGIKETTDNCTYWIIASDAETACRKLRQLFRKRRLANPRITSVEKHGTVDYIPSTGSAIFQRMNLSDAEKLGFIRASTTD